MSDRDFVLVIIALISTGAANAVNLSELASAPAHRSDGASKADCTWDPILGRLVCAPAPTVVCVVGSPPGCGTNSSCGGNKYEFDSVLDMTSSSPTTANSQPTPPSVSGMGASLENLGIVPYEASNSGAGAPTTQEGCIPVSGGGQGGSRKGDIEIHVTPQ